MLPNCARSLFSNVFGLSWLGFWSRLGFSRYTPLSGLLPFFAPLSVSSAFPLSLSLSASAALLVFLAAVCGRQQQQQAVFGHFWRFICMPKGSSAHTQTHLYTHTHAAKWKSDSALCFSFFAFFSSPRNLLWGCLMHESKWKMNLIHLQTTVRVIARWFTKWPTHTQIHTNTQSLILSPYPCPCPTLTWLLALLQAQSCFLCLSLKPTQSGRKMFLLLSVFLAAARWTFSPKPAEPSNAQANTMLDNPLQYPLSPYCPRALAESWQLAFATV